MASAKDLISPAGQPLIREPNLIVIKHPRSTHLNPNLIVGLSQATRCAVIELPMDSELMMGEIAQKELYSIHSAIHAVSQVPDINFTKEEMSVLYAALRYLCEHTAPTEGSSEVKLMKTIKRFVQ